MLVPPEDNPESNQNPPASTDAAANVSSEPVSSTPDTSTNDTPAPPLEDSTPPVASQPDPEPAEEPLSSQSPETPPSSKLPPTSSAPKSKAMMSMVIKVVVVVIIVAGLCTGAFFLGKHHEKVIVRSPAPQPINLPPQATVLTACVPGRGKQYIIPKDIPTGPIYDVENSKVIAVEYNLNIAQLLENSDTFSNAILDITRQYQVNHFSLVPATTSATSASNPSALTNFHLIMFMVSKSVSNAITCGTTSATTAT